MKTILRSTLAVALLASAAPALAGEDPPDQGATGIQPRSGRETEERGRSARITEGVAVEAPAEGPPVAAARDGDAMGRSSGADPLDRSVDGGG